MWYICNPSGSAHAVSDNGSRIAVRRFPDPRNSPDWIVMVDGIWDKSLGKHETRSAAMKQVEVMFRLVEPKA